MKLFIDVDPRAANRLGARKRGKQGIDRGRAGFAAQRLVLLRLAVCGVRLAGALSTTGVSTTGAREVSRIEAACAHPADRGLALIWRHVLHPFREAVPPFVPRRLIAALLDATCVVVLSVAAKIAAAASGRFTL